MESSGMNWRKSSYSGNGGSNCVEVSSPDAVLVRDTTSRDGGTLAFTTTAWKAFTAQLKRSLDTPQPACRGTFVS
jgi:hypothetical protein